jgi:hypothetical protein
MDIYDFETYVFDFDGVVVNSEYYHYLSYKKAFESLDLDFPLTYDKYCNINHSLNDLHFKEFFPTNYDTIHEKKRGFYNEYIDTDIQLQNGFKEFYINLIAKGKKVYIVSDTSSSIISRFIARYPFLKTINNLIIADCTTPKKPNPAGFIKVLRDLKDIKTDMKKIICFEDSLRGFTAASKVIYNVVLVNKSNYYYYNDISAVNVIEDFATIDTFIFQFMNIKPIPFYISSKTKHISKWSQIKKNKFINMTASWVDNEKPKAEMSISEKEELCQSFLDDIKKSDFGIFYSEIDDTEQIGSFIEFGILVSLNKPIYVMGFNRFKDEVFSHISSTVNYEYINNYNIVANILNIYIDNSLHYQEFCKLIQDSISQSTPLVKIDKPINYVAIVASGEGTRLMPLTKDIPKLLVCYKNDSILTHIVDYWKTYTDNFIIVIHSKYNKVIKFYMDLMKVKYTIINVNIRKGQENSYTIHSAFKSKEYAGKKILITWCDIYPCSPLPNNIFDDKNIIFTYKNFGRYDAYDNKIVKKPFGNVIGIYYFSSFINITKFQETMDICDCYLDTYSDFNTFEIEDLVDIGDMNKLDSLITNRQNMFITRYFNKIVDFNERLLKISTCEHGNKIINDELLFYKYCFLNNYTAIPQIYSFNNASFEMQKLNGDTVYNIFLTKSFDLQCTIIKDVIQALENLHSSRKIFVNKNIIQTDIFIEFFDKVRLRVNNVKPLLNEFCYIKTVNDVIIVDSADVIIEKVFKKIQSYFQTKQEYTLLHGDPHMSNMILENNNITFIDPRGYFGTTKLFGLPEYDIGKILYSLSGFDIFNNDEKFCFFISDTNIHIPINNVMDNFISLFSNYDKELLLNMVILHWFGLTDYSKNNIHKCVSAYYYGLYLYHTLFN